jgi:hypothetical protein
MIPLLLALAHPVYAAGKHAPLPSPTPFPSATASPLPLGIHFSPIQGKANEVTRVLAADAKIQELIAGSCFEDFFRKRSLVQTELNGKTLTNEEVIQAIRSARLQIPIVYYYANNGTVGYRQPPDNTIYVNRKFHDGYSVCSEASGNGHEALHVLGFDHDFRRTARRPFSVPYSWNAMTNDCCH